MVQAEVCRETKGTTRVQIPAGASLCFSCKRLHDHQKKKVQTTRGSVLESVLQQFKNLNKPYLISTDLKGDPVQVSGALHALVKRGALARSPGILSVQGSERFYLYYGLPNKPIQEDLIETFLEENLPDKRIVQVYTLIQYGGEILSNYDIRSEHGAIDLVQLKNYTRNGLLRQEYIKRHNDVYIDATFYIPRHMEKEEVDRAVQEKLSSSILKRKEAIGKGKEFENSLYDAFGSMFTSQSLQFRIFDHSKQVRKPLAGGRLRIFDMVAYAAPVIIDDDGCQKPLKWFHGSLKLVFEFKYNFRVTKGFLAEYCLDVHEAYGDMAVPVVVAGGDPGFGAVYDSGWQFAKYHNGVWLITGSSLARVLDTGSIPSSQAREEGERNERKDIGIYNSQRIDERTPENNLGGPDS